LTTLITNIHLLAGVRDQSEPLRGSALSELPVVEDAYLLIEDGEIASWGRMQELAFEIPTLPRHVVDARGATVLPAWCDSHTHLVFAGSRETEFVDKIRGITYAEIAARGGGILNSSRKLNAMGEEELFRLAQQRLHELVRLGTGAIEIKSGYGLSVEGELKMLRVIKRLRENSPIPVKASFLGAHTYPPAYRDNHAAYLDEIINQMLPVIAEEKLADFIDVFCETGFFSPEETETICRAGMKYGLRPKLHVNQLNSIGGLQTALRQNALSADHLETMTDADISDLAASHTIATLLPTAAYFLRMPFQPARALIDAGCTVALASDFNPGSSPSGNMNTVVSMSCIQMRMLPAEAINAATLNGAYAMDLGHDVGSFTKGKKANLIFTRPIPSIDYLPYAFGTNLIDKVMVNGSFYQ
jgi:imidazolonepropionase